MKRIARTALLASAVIIPAMVMPIGSSAYAQTANRTYSIAPQELGAALRQFATQSGRDVVFDPAIAAGKTSKGIKGSLDTQAALRQLIEGSGLTFTTTSSGFAIRSAEGNAFAADSASSSGDEATSNGQEQISEILVVGSRSQNVDIRRTEDSPQPYVVFGTEEIRESQAATVNEFLRSRLPMNQQPLNSSSFAGSAPRSAVDLRGLGQTLILVNGRRYVGRSQAGDLDQLDLNGIPMSAIERIEVLPTTASGIYGGSATGGVVNVILRQDYSGADVSLNFGSPFDTDAHSFRAEISGGFHLEGGRTQVFYTGSYSASQPLLVKDRNFLRDARRRMLANNGGDYASLNSFFLYPPLGYTTNIASQNGSNLVLDNGTPLNSPRTYVPIGYAGPATDGGMALVANAGTYNIDPANSVDVSGGGATSLVNDPTTYSIGVNAKREFTSWLSAYVDVAWSRVDGHFQAGVMPFAAFLTANDANNPFTTPIIAKIPVLGVDVANTSREDLLRVTGGAIAKIASTWSIALEHNFAKNWSSRKSTSPVLGDPDGAGPGKGIAVAFVDGTLNILGDVNAFPLDYGPYLMPSPSLVGGPNKATSNNTVLRFGGELLKMPGGPISLNGLVEHQRDELKPTNECCTFGFGFYGTEKSQNRNSGYLETRLPIVSDSNRRSGIELFDVQLSGRYDDYKSKAFIPGSILYLSGQDVVIPELQKYKNSFDKFSYTAAARYSPVEGVILRASYSTGFQPPRLAIITPSIQLNATSFIVDPKRGNVLQLVSGYTAIRGGNPDLEPERSRSFSAGVIIAPPSIPGLRVSMDYTKIRKKDEIGALTTQQLIDLEETYPDRVVRAPLTPQDQTLGFTGGAITQLDTSNLNIANSKVKAIDVQANYETKIDGLGKMELYGIVTRQNTLQRQFLPDTPTYEYVGFTGGAVPGPLKWRGNFGVTLTTGPVRVGWNGQYYHSYHVYSPTEAESTKADLIHDQGSDKIPSQFYNDVFVTYELSSRMSWLKGAELTLGVQNLFNKSPPIIVADSQAGPGYSLHGDPRLRRFSINARVHF